MAYLGNSLGIGSSAVSASASAVTAFVVTQSIIFDSVDDSIEVSGFNATTLIGAGDVSAAAWVKADTTDTGVVLHIGADDFPTNSNYLSLGYYSGSGFKIIGRDGAGGGATAEYTHTLTPNTWYHVGFTRTGTTTKLYVNGVLRDTTTNAENGVTVGDTLIIGNLPSRGFAWDGNIAMLHIWDSVLTDGNFSSLYNSGDPINPTTIASGNVIAAFPFEEGTGTDTEDISTNGNDGVLTNGPTWSTDVPVYVFNRYSVDFDGIDDYMSVPDSNDLSFGNASTDSAFSISAWIKNDSIGATQRIVTKASSTSSIEYMFTINGSNQLGLYLYDGSSGNRIGATTNVALSSGVWYHVVATYDGNGANTGINLYVDTNTGTRSLDSAGSYVAMHNTSDPVRVGSLSYTSQYFDGKIDGVAIFNYELSAANVSTIYNSGEVGDISSLSPVAHWRMGDNDGGTGTTITNQGSASGIDGTLTNGPTFSTDVPT